MGINAPLIVAMEHATEKIIAKRALQIVKQEKTKYVAKEVL